MVMMGNGELSFIFAFNAYTIALLVIIKDFHVGRYVIEIER